MTAPAKNRAKPRALEEGEQCALVQWIKRLQPQLPHLLNFTAIPNGGMRPQRVDPNTGRRFSVEAIKMIRMGSSPGYPDTLLDIAAGGYHGLRIEMKAGDAKPSDKQRDWIARLRVAGYRCEVCYTWVQAARVIAEYLVPVLNVDQVRVIRNSLPGR